MAFKVFDLQCDQSHIFEGWFSSHEDYDAQQARGLLTCPICNSATITKRLSAPRLNVSHLRNPQPKTPESPQTSSASAPPAAPSGNGSVAALDATAVARMQAAVLQEIRNVIRNTENVGTRFAEEARLIHEGEAEERAIRGTATPEEREALAEDGIAVVALPDFLDDDKLQ
jgi:hypothetical protein